MGCFETFIDLEFFDFRISINSEFSSIYSDENGIINIDTNIASPYISNEKYCSTIATFSNVNTDENFIYYYPNNLVYHKVQGNEIQDIDIFISDKSNKQLKLLEGVPTIVKFILKT